MSWIFLDYFILDRSVSFTYIIPNFALLIFWLLGIGRYNNFSINEDNPHVVVQNFFYWVTFPHPASLPINKPDRSPPLCVNIAPECAHVSDSLGKTGFQIRFIWA